jgi:hypothetical protein
MLTLVKPAPSAQRSWDLAGDHVRHALDTVLATLCTLDIPQRVDAEVYITKEVPRISLCLTVVIRGNPDPDEAEAVTASTDVSILALVSSGSVRDSLSEILQQLLRTLGIELHERTRRYVSMAGSTAVA